MASITVQALNQVPGVTLGARIDNVDLENLTDDDFSIIRDALCNYHLVLFKNQRNLSPKAQYQLTKRFDPTAREYSHGASISAETNRTHHFFSAVPQQPEVQLNGNGFIESYEGAQDVKMRHPHHRRFHRDPIPEDKDGSFTRFYRWHIDAALYELYPPKVTTLMAVQVPKGRRQTILYADGSGDTLDASLATTAFVSGQKTFELLSPEDQEFVKTSKVEYAPHPYVWMKHAQSYPTGLGLYSEGRELLNSDLPPYEPEKILILPMAWKNPVTGNLSLQIHPCAIRKIHRADGAVIEDLERVRDIVYRPQRPAISPQYVYAHDWSEGDMVLFNNHGVLHSVVGTLRPDEVRLFRQCNLAASEAPSGP
ncbi:Alpha-ketoglutarate-dependent xanthine dioxygenase xanA [Cladobotryum mycophilum]|uniref:Alpha-ketoglutarate-dependent xanthine dioxygenase xanA n=1 Tax=Cladobotryum mycophilum TaxID=491253 RepID=A0ABR0SRF1_9HYPO